GREGRDGVRDGRDRLRGGAAAPPGGTEREVEVSETVQRTGTTGTGPPAGQPPGNGGLNLLQRSGTVFIRQREATVFVVAVLLVIYFGFISSASSNFFSKLDLLHT